MAASGADALIARDRCTVAAIRATLPIADILKLQYTTQTTRCSGCGNRCMLTINEFSNGQRHVTGNRCEKGLGGTPKENSCARRCHGRYSFKRMFDYPSLPEKDAPRGRIGIPRVLNLYENYPFWATFFRQLGFSVLLSPALHAQDL